MHTSQAALKQSYTEKANNSKPKNSPLGNNFCKLCIMHFLHVLPRNKVKVLSDTRPLFMFHVSCGLGFSNSLLTV